MAFSLGEGEAESAPGPGHKLGPGVAYLDIKAHPDGLSHPHTQIFKPQETQDHFSFFANSADKYTLNF